MVGGQLREEENGLPLDRLGVVGHVLERGRHAERRHPFGKEVFRDTSLPC